MPRPPEPKPLRHLMADNRDKTLSATVPCPRLPGHAYQTDDPVAEAFHRDRWKVYHAPDATEATETHERWDRK